MKAKKKHPDLIPQLRQERFQMAIIEELVELNSKIDKLITVPTISEPVETVSTTKTKKTTKKVATKKDNEVK